MGVVGRTIDLRHSKHPVLIQVAFALQFPAIASDSSTNTPVVTLVRSLLQIVFAMSNHNQQKRMTVLSQSMYLQTFTFMRENEYLTNESKGW